MSTLKPLYGSSVAVFSTDAILDGLANSVSLLGGVHSPTINNNSGLLLDALLSGRFKANNTAPTAGGRIEVWVGAMLDDTNYPDVFDSTESTETITSSDIKNSILRLAASIPNDATANRIYEFAPVSVAELFGGMLPKNWFVFVTQSTGQALNTTTNNGGQCWYTPVQVQSV